MKKYGWNNIRGTFWHDGPQIYIPKKIKDYVNDNKLKSNNRVLEVEENHAISPSKSLEVSTQVIYVLKLENHKWYIGKTDDLKMDLEKHKNHQKSSWTKLYKMLSVEEVVKMGDLMNITIDYMRKYGWGNVKGYKWSAKEWPPKELNDQFKGYIEADRAPEIVYVLRLEHEKWFIGKTKNLKWSLKTHDEGSPPWTDIHKVIEVSEIYEKGDSKSITLKYMKRFGWENVRGHAWRRWDLQNPPRELRS